MGVLNKETKEQWLKALRSGEYSQTMGYLRDDTGFCCLGVLCDIKSPDSWERERNENYYIMDSSYYNLPEDVVKKSVTVKNVLRYISEGDFVIHLDDDDRKMLKGCVGYFEYFSQVHLSELNDEDVPFRVIADLIEKHL